MVFFFFLKNGVQDKESEGGRKIKWCLVGDALFHLFFMAVYGESFCFLKVRVGGVGASHSFGFMVSQTKKWFKILFWSGIKITTILTGLREIKDFEQGEEWLGNLLLF